MFSNRVLTIFASVREITQLQKRILSIGDCEKMHTYSLHQSLTLLGSGISIPRNLFLYSEFLGKIKEAGVLKGQLFWG